MNKTVLHHQLNHNQQITNCTTRFDKKIRGIFLQTAIERAKQLDSSQPKVDLQLSFCVNMLNLAAKPYPYILYCYININTHQLNIYHCIFALLDVFLINTDQKKTIKFYGWAI